MGSVSAGFKISGEFITEHCRNLMFENNWPFAMQTLVEGIVGFTYDDAIAVLSGQKQLIGVNNINLIDEANKAEYTDRYNKAFCGIYRHSNGTYWRPYARVTCWGESDLIGPGREMVNKHHPYPSRPRYGAGGFPRPSSHDKVWRSLYYAQRPENDWCHVLILPFSDSTGEKAEVPSEALILFQQIPTPPLWQTTFSYFQAALDDYLKFRALEVRGQHLRVRYKPSDLDKDIVDHVDNVSKDKYESSNMDDMILKAALANGLDENVAKSTLQFIKGEQDRDSVPEPDKKMESNYGWVTADGQFYPCEFHAHDALASRIIQHFMKQKPPEGLNACDLLLENAGAIKITTSMATNEPVISFSPEIRMTKNQWLAAFEWCAQHNVDSVKVGLPDWDNRPRGNKSGTPHFGFEKKK